MNKKISLGAAIAFMAIVAAATLSITMMVSLRRFNSKVSNLKEREEQYSKIEMIDRRVRDNFYGTVEQDKLMNEIARGYIAGLGDPYAEYYDAAQYERLQNESSGKTVQIGILTGRDESGYVKVTEVYPDSPAFAAGIEAGDLIVKIEDTDITSENYVDALRMLRGEAGTKLSIVLRKGTEETALELTRRFVETPSVSSIMLEGNLGLITFDEFNGTTPDQFIKQVDSLIDQGAIGLIFDVRSVDTCTIDSVAEVLDKLLPEGVLAYSVDKANVKTPIKTSDAREVMLPMAVLINEKTTSEAELFAACIRDFNKGKLVGIKTFGKGTIQRVLPLQDGSGAVRITTAKYLTPLSTSFDLEGVKPDFEVRMSADLINNDNPNLVIDVQLAKAVEVVLSAARADGLQNNGSSEQEPAVSSSGDDSASLEEGEEVVVGGEWEEDEEESGSGDSSEESSDGEEDSAA